MERVTGIGGFFFPSPDPERLAAWYAANLGIDEVPKSYEEGSWRQEAGPTIFAAMAPDDPQFGTAHSWAINFRVHDLAAMVAQLRKAGIEVEVDPSDYPNGVFASLIDPDGNPIQLWEPRGLF